MTALRILHVLSACVWVGGTVALVFVGVPAIRQLEGEARATAMRTLGRRWRPIGWSAMAVAILSGLWLTDRHGGFNRAALDTDFDRTLIAKSVLVALPRRRRPAPRLPARPAAPARAARDGPVRTGHPSPARRRRLVQLRAHDRRAGPRRGRAHDARLRALNDAARHLALLTRTTEVVNSSLDLQEVLEAIAHEVAAALETDCLLRLPLRRASRRARAARDPRHPHRGRDQRAAHAKGRGDHRRRRRRARGRS